MTATANSEMFWRLTRIFISRDLLTHDEAVKIARPGTRKGALHKRHIIDLCSYVLEKMERRSVDDALSKELCETAIKIAKGRSNEI